MHEYYLRSVDRRWRKEVAQALGRVIICSPYLTPKTASSIISAAERDRCEVYTRFSVEDFASGASSLRTLKALLQAGYSIFELDNLHAKIILVSGVFVSVGSQNLTARGLKNKEATATSTDPDIVRRIELLLDPWLTMRRPITLEMISELEELIRPIALQYRRVQRVARAAEETIRQHETERLSRIQADQRRKEAAAYTLRQLVAAGRAAISKLTFAGQVPEEVAREFLRRSTWWHTHSSGKLVRAPNHARRMYGANGNWKIDFGANTFLVGRAVERCARTLERYIKTVESENPWTKQQLIRRLREDAAGAVAHRNGSEYAGSYPLTGNDLMFGATSINVEDFAQAALESLPRGLINAAP